MRVLIVTAGFFPGNNYGGPPVSIDNLCSLLCGEDIVFFIVTRNHDLNDSTPYADIHDGWNERANCKVLYVSDDEFTYSTFLRVTEEIRPDLIYLQSLFQTCTLACLRLARNHGIHVLLAPRGELCEGAFKQKRYKKLPYTLFLRFSHLLKKVMFQSTSDEETKAIIRLLHVDSSRICELSNVPSIPIHELRRPVKKPGSARMVFISRITPKKNLHYALECLRPLHGNVQMDIYGPLEDEQYWKGCQNIITSLPDNVKATYCGTVEHGRIHEVFARYDAFIFPTLSENYGHVIAESLAAGCPVIISDQTPWNAVSEDGAGWAIPLENPEDFSSKMQMIISLDTSQEQLLRKNAVLHFNKRFNVDKMRMAYVSAFRSSITEIR